MEILDHNESNYDIGDNYRTIEYLRARLLSERSVSKSAKQRVYELTDQVAELEEQLKVVYLQRKKTEKATSDVLAILGGLAIGDDFEGCDMVSDQDSTRPQACNGGCLENNTDKSRSMDQQGHEPLTFSSRNLAWKSSRCSPHCERKFVSGPVPSRRRINFPSAELSSPKHRLGKSCRQNKHRELRSTVDELSNNEAISDFQIASDDFKNSICNHESQDEKLSARNTEPVSLTSHRKIIDYAPHFLIHQENKEMERALECQANLIYRYEAEENAQIEWEEKYKEKNGSTPESLEPGNQSDVTEERDELKRQPCFQSVNEAAHSGSKSALINVSNEYDLQPSRQKIDGPIYYQKVDSEVYRHTHTPHPVIAVPINETKQTQDKQKCYLSSTQRAATNSTCCKGKTSKTTLRESIKASNEPSKELVNVLEGLQRAKLSLQLKLRKSGLSEDRYVHAMSFPDRAQMPASCAALFRVPTNFQAEENGCKSYLNSRSCTSLMDRYHESTSTVRVNDKIELKPQETIPMSNVSKGSSFDFAPNWQNNLSSLGSGDEYARRPVLTEKAFCNSDRFRFTPQNEAPRSNVTGSDGQAEIPYPDAHFSFPSDLYRPSSQLDNDMSGIYGTDLHGQGSYVNRSSPSSSRETTTPSLIGNDQFVGNNCSGCRSSMSSPTQLHSNSSCSVSPQLFSKEPHYNSETDIYPSSHARQPALPYVPDFNPPTFRGFP